MRSTVTIVLAFILGSFCGITQSQQNAVEQKPSQVNISINPFTELEQVKLLNAYRKAKTSGDHYTNSGCAALTTDWNENSDAYNKLLADIEKGHGIETTRDIVMDLKKDTVQPAPKPESKK